MAAQIDSRQAQEVHNNRELREGTRSRSLVRPCGYDGRAIGERRSHSERTECRDRQGSKHRRRTAAVRRRRISQPRRGRRLRSREGPGSLLHSPVREGAHIRPVTIAAACSVSEQRARGTAGLLSRSPAGHSIKERENGYFDP